MKRRVAAGLLLATAVLLSGCVQKPEEGSTLPPLPSASPTPSAAPSPKLTGTDLEQIIALTKDYFTESTRALNTGDTRRVRAMAAPGCVSCDQAATYVETHWKHGSIRAPGYYQVSEVSFPKVVSPTTGYSTAVYTTRPEIRLDSSGRVIKTTPANPRVRTATLYFMKAKGFWRVARIVRNN